MHVITNKQTKGAPVSSVGGFISLIHYAMDRAAIGAVRFVHYAMDRAQAILAIPVIPHHAFSAPVTKVAAVVSVALGSLV